MNLLAKIKSFFTTPIQKKIEPVINQRISNLIERTNNNLVLTKQLRHIAGILFDTYQQTETNNVYCYLFFQNTQTEIDKYNNKHIELTIHGLQFNGKLGGKSVLMDATLASYFKNIDTLDKYKLTNEFIKFDRTHLQPLYDAYIKFKTL